MNCNNKLLSFLMIIFLLNVFYNDVSAQSFAKNDSIKKLLNETRSDSVKIREYSNLSWNYATTRIKLDSARMYADSVKQISERANFRKGIVRSHYYYGVINRFEGNYKKAIEHLNIYVQYNVKSINPWEEANGLFQIGVCQYHLGNFEKSLISYHRILDIYKQKNDLKSVASTLHSIGNIRRKLKKYDEAIESYKESIKIKEKLNDQLGLSMSFESLGNTYSEMDKFLEAKDNLDKALKISLNDKDEDGIASIYENLGKLYIKTKTYDNALKYYLKALNIREKQPSKRNLASILSKIGDGYAKLKKNDLAKSYLLRSVIISKEINTKPILMNSYKSLMEISESIGNYKEAYVYKNAFVAVKDSIFNADKVKQLNELEAKYETAKKDQEINLLIKEKEIQEKEARRKSTLNKAIIGGLAFVLLVAGLLFYMFRQKVKNQKIVSQKNAQITEVNYKQQLSELEMKALRAQMNPHFVFNCLNSINRMILGGEIKDASSYLTKFSRLIRKVLENSEKNMVSVADELTMLKAYIQLESLRFKGKITYKTNIDKNINLEVTFIPSMVLQPLIENAIWHGLMHKDKGGTILLSILKQDDVLKCSVEDNGIGRQKSATLSDKPVIKQKSMGLKLTSERLKIMSKLGLKRFINIIDLKDENNKAIGTRVDVLIPLT